MSSSRLRLLPSRIAGGLGVQGALHFDAVKHLRRHLPDQRFQAPLILQQASLLVGHLALLVRNPFVEPEESHVDRVRIDLDGCPCRTISFEQTSGVAGKAVPAQRFAKFDPGLATRLDVRMGRMRRRLVLPKSASDLALDVAFGAVQHRRVDRDNDRTLDRSISLAIAAMSETSAVRRRHCRFSRESPSSQQMPLSFFGDQARSRPMKVGIEPS